MSCVTSKFGISYFDLPARAAENSTMNRKIILLLASFAFATSVYADQHVSGYVRRDGTVVQPYVRSDANNTRNDNYGTRGNTNPYTGTRGSAPRDEDAR